VAEERVKRKLAAIVSADVVGWSRLMGEDEAAHCFTVDASTVILQALPTDQRTEKADQRTEKKDRPPKAWLVRT